MKTFSIGASLKRGWELFKGNKSLLILSTLVLLISSSFQNIESKANDVEIGVVSLITVLSILFFVFSLFVQLGWTKVLLKVEDGLKTEVREIFQHGNLFWKYLGTSLLLMIITMIGFILLIIPGVYLMLKYMFAPVIVIDKQVTIREAFDHSKTLTQDIKWKLFGTIIVLGFVNVLGILALGVGVLVSIPVSALAYIHIYRILSQEISPVVAQETTPVSIS